jgi:glyoxylase-like metal-dependent hydrolase (beta-lactamase superfamily II)
MFRLLPGLALAALLAGGRTPEHAGWPALQLETFVADSGAFDVSSTLIIGPSEALLVDGQFRPSDASRLADRVAATGKRLTAIVVTHPHDDHYLGLEVLHRRFPEAPIYMSPAGIEIYRRQSPRYVAIVRRLHPDDAPDSLPAVLPFPSTHLAVDGQDVEVVADQQGDELVPSNTYLWIPSLRAVVAGDIVFNGVHVWLANSNHASRQRWLRALDGLSARHPAIVVAGHKRDAATPDTPEAIALTRGYIAAFDTEADRTMESDTLVARMARRYPSLALPRILERAAVIAVPD